MRTPIVVPELGIGHESLRVSGWFVEEGDLVLPGDLIAEVLIPGITFDIAAESSGRLAQIVIPVDATITTGSILGWLEDSAEIALPTTA